MDRYITSESDGSQITPDEIFGLSSTTSNVYTIVHLRTGKHHVVLGSFEDISTFWGR